MTNINKEQGGKAPFTIRNPASEPSTISIGGRARWAPECLIRAGQNGCTPTDDPAPRWSGYIIDLRALGVDIETVTEPHSGPFSGRHARYVLRSDLAEVRASVARAEARAMAPAEAQP